MDSCVSVCVSPEHNRSPLGPLGIRCFLSRLRPWTHWAHLHSLPGESLKLGFQFSIPGPVGECQDSFQKRNATQTRSFSTGLGLPGFLTQEASLFSPFPFQEAIRHKSFFEPERKLECGDVDEAFKVADEILEGKPCFSREPQGTFWSCLV